MHPFFRSFKFLTHSQYSTVQQTYTRPCFFSKNRSVFSTKRSFGVHPESHRTTLPKANESNKRGPFVCKRKHSTLMFMYTSTVYRASNGSRRTGRDVGTTTVGSHSALNFNTGRGDTLYNPLQHSTLSYLSPIFPCTPKGAKPRGCCRT